MDGDLESYLAEHDQIVTAREARSVGIRTEKIRAAVHTGELVRVVRGGYVTRSAMLAVRFEARHVLRTTVLLRTRPEDLAASHTSAAVMWGLPVTTSAMERMHVCHRTRKGTTRLHREFTVHCCPGEGAVVAAQVVRSSNAFGIVLPDPTSDRAHAVAGPSRCEAPTVPVVHPAVAAIQSALLTRPSIAVSIMDAVRHRGLATVPQLQDWLGRMRFVPGIPHAREALERSDGLAESSPESWLRLILLELGYTVVAQHAICEDGRVFARVDFYLPELGVVVEFDGRVKYVRADGTGDADAVVAEKHREDRIRRLGYGVVRVGNEDLTKPELIDRYIKDAARTVPRVRPAS
ncbi:hypothetical protein [Ornithinimicrobium sp. W1665]|uniref:hypothetical protein n=1 Tax=Ornithinimicrobium sp. W1665 TaxID=3416666 RepID=UPI003CF75272